MQVTSENTLQVKLEGGSFPGLWQDGEGTLQKGGRVKILLKSLGRNTFEPVLLPQAGGGHRERWPTPLSDTKRLLPRSPRTIADYFQRQRPSNFLHTCAVHQPVTVSIVFLPVWVMFGVIPVSPVPGARVPEARPIVTIPAAWVCKWRTKGWVRQWLTEDTQLPGAGVPTAQEERAGMA